MCRPWVIYIQSTYNSHTYWFIVFTMSEESHKDPSKKNNNSNKSYWSEGYYTLLRIHFNELV